MIIDTTNYWHSPVRSLAARVELYNGSALADAFTAYYALKSFTIDRVGESNKFFGYGICQKMNLKLVDKDRAISISTANSIKSYLSTGGDLISSFPTFYVSQVNRDENTNELSITAYDALYKATKYTVADLELVAPYSLLEFAEACAALLGVTLNIGNIALTEWQALTYTEGANFNGSENIRVALDAIAEVTQSIYFIDKQGQLTFKRLDKDGAAALTIDKDRYITLESGANRRLATIMHATDLGDNVSASITTGAGSTQYIRNNPFWDLREDIADLVDGALAAMGGLTINQFECEWRGNPALEIGDKIELITKDSQGALSYILDDVITYDGSLSQKTRWHYEEDEAEDADNPTSLGDALNKTSAKVDKVNQRIELVATSINENTNKITELSLDIDSVSSTVKRVETNTQAQLDAVNNNISTLTEKTNLMQTAEDVKITVEQELNNGVNKVMTTTGFTFDDSGLTIEKSDSEMSTRINDDGMTINKNDEQVLTANNRGVSAINLHATTYLIIGDNSRFENYELDGAQRTACFWIGE